MNKMNRKNLPCSENTGHNEERKIKKYKNETVRVSPVTSVGN